MYEMYKFNWFDFSTCLLLHYSETKKAMIDVGCQSESRGFWSSVIRTEIATGSESGSRMDLSAGLMREAILLETKFRSRLN